MPSPPPDYDLGLLLQWAFARGAKGDDDLDLKRLHGGGRGKVLLTASRGTEYSFEGEPVLGSSEAGSIFTSALIDGITTGDADFDHDGLIYVDDLYHYAFETMQAINARQYSAICSQPTMRAGYCWPAILSAKRSPQPRYLTA